MKNTYELMIVRSPLVLPFSFANHIWFVTKNNTELSRYEVLYFNSDHNNSYVKKNFFKPFEEISIIPFFNKFLWKPKVIYRIEGKEAERISNFLEASLNKYPYKNSYSILGPNSNTYVKWVMGHFPSHKVKLPMFSIGKNYVESGYKTGN